MVKRLPSQTTSEAIAELQTALDMQDAAEKLVAARLARLATLLSATESRHAEAARRRRHRHGPVLVVSNPPVSRAPITDNAA
jgi:hypothetical protein